MITLILYVEVLKYFTLRIIIANQTCITPPPTAVVIFALSRERREEESMPRTAEDIPRTVEDITNTTHHIILWVAAAPPGDPCHDRFCDPRAKSRISTFGSTHRVMGRSSSGHRRPPPPHTSRSIQAGHIENPRSRPTRLSRNPPAPSTWR